MNVYLKFVKNAFGAIISSHSDNYPTPINLSYFWGIGSLAGIALIIQLVSGILLAMHYTPEVNLAFLSVEHIMRDVVGGSGLRYIHANGASMFFIVVYAHMFRGLYYGSYYQPRSLLWYTGVIIFLLMMATAFMGYVLPWGQMSFWGATVITNLFSAIPYIGNYIVQLLWGGFSVDNPTLNRFFSLHYLMPFIIAALAGLHLALLHKDGSNNPLGIESTNDKISFLPYFYVKDFFGACLFALFFSFFVIYAPNYLGHPDNYIEANPMVTPAHIVPEWYFLPFYAILRTIPDKLGGVALMVFAIVILLFLPNLDNSYIRSTFFKPFHLIMFWGFLSICLILGWIGQEVVETPFIELSLFVTPAYFIYFLILIPFFSNIERIIIDQKFIGVYVNQLNEKNIKKLYSVSLINPLTIEFIESFDFFGFFYNIINICLIIFFIIILSLILPTRAKSVRTVNLLSTFYLFILLYFNYFNFNSSVVYLSNGNLFNINWIFILFFFLITFLVIIFFLSISSVFYLEENYKVEYNFLIFFLYLNAILLLFVNDFISVIIILECIAFSSYILVGFETKNKYSVSSGIKYLIWGSMPAGFFILGLSFLYYGYGTFNLNYLEILLISNNPIGDEVNESLSLFFNEQEKKIAEYTNFFSSLSVDINNLNEVLICLMKEYTLVLNAFCYFYNPKIINYLLEHVSIHQTNMITASMIMYDIHSLFNASIKNFINIFDIESFVYLMFLIKLRTNGFMTNIQQDNYWMDFLNSEIFYQFKLFVFKKLVESTISDELLRQKTGGVNKIDDYYSLELIKENLFYLIENNIKKDNNIYLHFPTSMENEKNMKMLDLLNANVYLKNKLYSFSNIIYDKGDRYYLMCLDNDIFLLIINNKTLDFWIAYSFKDLIDYYKASGNFSDLDEAFIKNYFNSYYIDNEQHLKNGSWDNLILLFNYFSKTPHANTYSLYTKEYINAMGQHPNLQSVEYGITELNKNFKTLTAFKNAGIKTYNFVCAQYGFLIANSIDYNEYIFIDQLLREFNYVEGTPARELISMPDNFAYLNQRFIDISNNITFKKSINFWYSIETEFQTAYADFIYSLKLFRKYEHSLTNFFFTIKQYDTIYYTLNYWLNQGYNNLEEVKYPNWFNEQGFKTFKPQDIVFFIEESFQKNINDYYFIPEELRKFSPFTATMAYCATEKIRIMLECYDNNPDYKNVVKGFLGWFQIDPKKYEEVYSHYHSLTEEGVHYTITVLNENLPEIWKNSNDKLVIKLTKFFEYKNILKELNSLKDLSSFDVNTWETKSNFYFQESFYIIFIAIICILTNILFKLTAAPFHLWAPSIYGNSPLPTITFLSIFSKLTIIFLFINIMVIIFEIYNFIWQPLLFFFGILSVIVSILGALTEKYIKRFFVYSSISHIGFIILGIATLNFTGIQASIDYLILYIISSLIIWIILMFLTNKVTHIINLKGLVYNFNILSLIFVITLFSMGGLPPLGGFFVKFEIFYSLINNSLYIISYFLFILTLFNFFYYLRLIKVIYFEDNKIFKKFKHFDSIKLRIISILIFILPLYFILFGESWNFILQQIIIYSLK